MDPRQGRICLFAQEDIPALTELTYDYGGDYQDNRLGDGFAATMGRGSR